MLPRLWIVLLALLLLAAPAGSAIAETVDAPSEIGCCEDEDDATQVEIPRAEEPPHRAACTAMSEDAVSPAPVLARVFRPPRPSLD